MARTFDGTDDFITHSIGGCNITGPHSIAAIVRRNVNSVKHTIISLTDSSTVNERIRMGLNDSDARVIYATDGQGGATASVTLVASEGWALVAGNKPAGTSTPRLHKYVYGTNAWVHANGDITRVDNTAPGTGGKVLFGRRTSATPDYLNGDTLLIGVWNRELSDAEFERLPFSLLHWHASAPVGLWLLDQSLTTQNVVDFTGNGANQTAITGTAVATNHPPVWNRGHEMVTVTVTAPAAGQPTMRRWGGVPHLMPGPRLRGRSW